MTAAAPLPVSPALYAGRVMHHRMKPKAHRFSYGVFTCLLDLDRLDAANRASRVFSVGRFNLVSFYEKDFGAGESSGLAASIRRLLRDAGAEDAGAKIYLMAYPRILGFAFNPISIYYCYDRANRIAAMIYEVSNTFGQRHTYVAPVRQGELDESGLHQSCSKKFYVSPFLEMAMLYKFRVAAPDGVLRFRILEEDRDGPILAAAFSADRKSFTGASLLQACARLPLMTVKIVAAIHWEALRLWIKGVRLAPRPAPPGAASVDGHDIAIRKGIS